MMTGAIAESRAHYDRALLLYNPAEHRSLAARFGQDTRAAVLSYRSIALWLLGYPKAALVDADQALADAREIGQAATLMLTLTFTQMTQVFCGSYSRATALADELVAIAGEKALIILEGGRNAEARLALSLGYNKFKRFEHTHFSKRNIPVNGSNGVSAPLYLTLLAAASMEVAPAR